VKQQQTTFLISLDSSRAGGTRFLNASTPQRLNASTPQRLNASTPQRLNASLQLRSWQASHPQYRNFSRRGESCIRPCPDDTATHKNRAITRIAPTRNNNAICQIYCLGEWRFCVYMLCIRSCAYCLPNTWLIPFRVVLLHTCTLTMLFRFDAGGVVFLSVVIMLDLVAWRLGHENIAATT